MRFLCLATLFCFPFSFTFAQSDWEKQKEESGIVIYTQNIPNSSFKAFRGEGVVDATISTIVAVFLDMPGFKEWSPAVMEAKMIKEISLSERINYLVTDAPWPVTDRDGVYKFKITQDQQNKHVLVKVDALEGHYPIQKKRIRITNSTGYWKLIPIEKNKTKVIYENHADPAGNLPAWLVNSSSVNLPFNTIKNLRKQVKKGRYQHQQFDFIQDF